MGHVVCFEAGRLTQTQSSATAPSCSRKWMPGPADAWVEFVKDRKRRTAVQPVEPIAALQEPPPKSAGKVLFLLDKPLSWTSPKTVPPKQPEEGSSPGLASVMEGRGCFRRIGGERGRRYGSRAIIGIR